MIEETAAGDARAGPQAAHGQAQERAREVGRLMMADDRASRHLGIELLEIGPGRAKMSLAIRPELTNGHGICHGGYIFLLSDTAFAFACNSHNQRTVASGCTIEFLAPAHDGDVLTAEAVEQHRVGRQGVYDVRVNDQRGKLIALFRGKSATIKGQFFEETEQ
ncbi:MAG: hydroxyphenylacetyl-CoA thioesterase PaaI [Limnobacter sp.]|nr:hydroxyphenylacetyl-CoA thioesterase PaaI [Limnobacter sp.]